MNPASSPFAPPTALRRWLAGLAAIALAALLWLPCLHWFYARPSTAFLLPDGVSDRARRLAARHLHLWTNPALRDNEVKRMRASNAEWDFMGRSFLVWSFANLGLREPATAARYLPVMDQILDETLNIEATNGIYAFLMPYAKRGEFKVQPARSLFLDGEIALMLASRRLLQEKAEYRRPLTDLVNEMVARLQASPLMVAESYPDECWTYDHVAALAAIRAADRLDGTDHSEFCRRWLANARRRLLDPRTGMLISSFTLAGTPLDGPEGSTLWGTTHFLAAVDEAFARDQYDRARKALGRTVLGFAYCREWPASWVGHPDVDSGPIIPWLEASAGSSGMALIGAATFNDSPFLSALNASLDLAAFPCETQGRLRYAASNQVGDAAILYAAVQGPLWAKIRNQP